MVTVGTHLNADSVENIPTNHRNMLSVKTLEHYDDVSFRGFFVRIKVSFVSCLEKKRFVFS
jgi:hypothetical protein